MAIQRDADVELASQVKGFADGDLAHLLAFWAGLVRDELHAHHLGRGFNRSFLGGDELHAPALAAATRVDLRLDHCSAPAPMIECLADFLGDVGALVDDDAALHTHAVALEDLLALVLVDLHLLRSGCPPGRMHSRTPGPR